MKTYALLISEELLRQSKSRASLGREIGQSNQNLSHHFKNDSFPTDMLEKIQDVLGINLYEMRKATMTEKERKSPKYKNAIQPTSIAAENTNYNAQYTLSLSEKEIKQIVINQNQTIEQMRNDLAALDAKFRDYVRLHK